ncbi:MAG: amidohydrolase [Alphaproteobacteria bacterium]|nr:amidohydrolase [Alphaproteobacteria bacterium]
MLIDIYTHIFPKAFYQKMTEVAPKLENIGKRMQAVTELHDLDARFRTMDRFGDYRQIISLPNPPIEEVAPPGLGPTLARLANDAMAEMCRRNPDRFPSFVAAVCMSDIDATLAEIDRAIGELGAGGIQIFTNIAGRPLDEPAFRPVFDKMAGYDLPIWMHPTRSAAMPDYASEKRSRYEIWWCFGWPYETSVAMVRLVLSGLFDRHPKIKILTHHLGAMIPYFDGRVDTGMAVLGSRTTDEDYSQILPSLKRPHIDYYHMFYGDTAMFGSFHGTKCGIEWFGADQVVFSTDAPFAPIKETIEAVERVGLDRPAMEKICLRNAERLMNRRLG